MNSLQVYRQFIAEKRVFDKATGISDVPELNAMLKPHQRDIVTWALRRGRAAVFAGTGLGKTFMQLEWARVVHEFTGLPVLILAPLAVAAQTQREGVKFGIHVTHAHDQSEIVDGVNVTNYDRLEKFDVSAFGGVVLDESSILKAHDGKTRTMIIEAFAGTAFRLACTATPAPNDYMELGNHSEFLGVMTQEEMLAMFFIHDGGETQKWRLKGHAESEFWKWMCSWAVMLRKPSDLGYDNTGYDLPPLRLHQVTVDVDQSRAGDTLFVMEAATLQERLQERRHTIDERCKAAAEIVASALTGNCDKLATVNGDHNHGLETGIRDESEKEGTVGRGVSHKEDGSSETQRPGGKEAVHARVCKTEPGEIQEDSGATGEIQRGSAQEVCRECGASGENTRQGEELATSQSEQKEGAAHIQIWVDSGSVQQSDGVAGDEVRNLRTLGHIEQESLSIGGSLPCNRQSERDSLHELQSGAREIQRQFRTSQIRNKLSLKPVLIFCNLNDEQDYLESIFGDLAYSVRGSDKPENKERLIMDWLALSRPIMISKPSIMGFGLNFQHCSSIVFVGLNDSFEQLFQAIRRCWRFGQTQEVNVWLVAAETEGRVVSNLKRKEADAERMAEMMVLHMQDITVAELRGTVRNKTEYNPQVDMILPKWIFSDLDGETWKPVFDGVYSVSNMGRVKREKAGKGARVGIIAQPQDSAGYPMTSICINGEKKPTRTHVIVAEAFIGSRPDGYEINHKDGNKSNNKLSNLEYVTKSENGKHAWATGLQPKRNYKRNAK